MFSTRFNVDFFSFFALWLQPFCHILEPIVAHFSRRLPTPAHCSSSCSSLTVAQVEGDVAKCSHSRRQQIQCVFVWPQPGRPTCCYRSSLQKPGGREVVFLLIIFTHLPLLASRHLRPSGHFIRLKVERADKRRTALKLVYLITFFRPGFTPCTSSPPSYSYFVSPLLP